MNPVTKRYSIILGILLYLAINLHRHGLAYTIGVTLAILIAFGIGYFIGKQPKTDTKSDLHSHQTS